MNERTVVANGAWVRGVFIVIAGAALALVAVLPVDAIGEATAVVHQRVATFVELLEAATAGTLRVGRLVFGLDRTATGVTLRTVFADGDRVTIVQRAIETLVDLFDTHSAGTSRVGRFVNVTVSAPTCVLLRT